MNFSMPNDLIELENRLRLRAGEADAGLRESILQAVAEATQKLPPATIQRSSWNWMAIAAAALLVMNLSLIAASQDALPNPPISSHTALISELQAIRQIESQQEGQLR